MTRPVFFISVIPLPGITLPPGRVRFAFSSFSAGADSRDGYGWILFDSNCRKNGIRQPCIGKSVGKQARIEAMFNFFDFSFAELSFPW